MEAKKLTAQEIVPASRKLGRNDAKQLASTAKKITVAKGKKIVSFAGGKNVSDETIDSMLGPTGNLRAPTIVSGSQILVGYNEDVYEKVLTK
jgi:arsenate reductase-like glutaredoxin family protein